MTFTDKLRRLGTGCGIEIRGDDLVVVGQPGPAPDHALDEVRQALRAVEAGLEPIAQSHQRPALAALAVEVQAEDLVRHCDLRLPHHHQVPFQLPAAPGAHHSVLSPDERYLFVQNSLLNLEGMSDGSITVIDLTKDKVLGSIDTLKAQGFNPNCIMLLPNHFKPGGFRASAR